MHFIVKQINTDYLKKPNINSIISNFNVELQMLLTPPIGVIELATFMKVSNELVKYPIINGLCTFFIPFLYLFYTFLIPFLYLFYTFFR